MSEEMVAEEAWKSKDLLSILAKIIVEDVMEAWGDESLLLRTYVPEDLKPQIDGKAVPFALNVERSVSYKTPGAYDGWIDDVYLTLLSIMLKDIDGVFCDILRGTCKPTRKGIPETTDVILASYAAEHIRHLGKLIGFQSVESKDEMLSGNYGTLNGATVLTDTFRHGDLRVLRPHDIFLIDSQQGGLTVGCSSITADVTEKDGALLLKFTIQFTGTLFLSPGSVLSTREADLFPKDALVDMQVQRATLDSLADILKTDVGGLPKQIEKMLLSNRELVERVDRLTERLSVLETSEVEKV